MQFQQYDLGHLSGGEIVEVTLRGTAANVRLMNSSNFNSFKSGRRHRYYGGHARRSPVRLQVPGSGRWHVVVDLGGHAGRVNSAVRVLPGALKPIRDTPLKDVPSLFQTDAPPGVAGRGREWDVFISHASEDKESVVTPLVTALTGHGLQVWYDEFELRIGDSLRQKIDAGLAKSRFGLVVLSQAFLGKGWTNYELDGLVSRSVSGDQILLPVWHKLSKDEVMEYSPSLADKVARSTATHTLEEIATEIAGVIRGE